MQVGEALAKISYALRGLDDIAPTFGDEEAIYWLSVLNSKKDEYAQDIKQRWADNFDIRQLTDPVASGTQEYSLDTSFLAPSDEIYVVDSDGKKHYFTVIKPQQRPRYGSNEVYISSVNPKKLTFVNEISATSPLIGGQIFAPGYYRPDDMTTETSILPFSDPNWGVIASAAEIAFNDVVYETKAADLTGKANELYRNMAKANRALTYANGRRAAYNTSSFRITSPGRR